MKKKIAVASAEDKEVLVSLAEAERHGMISSLLLFGNAIKIREIIEKNNLGTGGFIPTHRHQLNMEGRKNVYVLGDTTNLPISKAGSTAHSISFTSRTSGIDY